MLKRTPRAGNQEAIAALARHFGARLSTNAGLLDQHGAGEAMNEIVPPEAVLFAASTDDVAEALAIAATFSCPVIGYGAGTSLEGQLQAIEGGLSIDLSQMTRIIEVNDGSLDCRVEAGVTREALNTHLRDMGLFFPGDPGANATIGGMTATRASGTNAVRYGTMRELVLGLTVVTPQGKIVRTGGRARKSASGYDLTRIYVGSEGTLGIITEIQLRLFGIPERIASAVCQFDTLDGAVLTAMQAMQIGLPMARIELLDALQMKASIAYSGLSEFAEKPTLFLEFHGSEAHVAEQVETFRAIATDNGGGNYSSAERTEDRNRLWQARHHALFAARALRAGAAVYTSDACVPISNLAECITRCRGAAEAAGLLAPVVGHVGDGNFHMIILFDPEDARESAAAENLAQFIATTAIALGGTITGEHGIGLHKLDALVEEHGEAVAIMARIKQALDPLDIMNPGKLVPPVYLQRERADY